MNNTNKGEWKDIIRLQVDNAWSRGTNWALKGRGYALDTDAEREIETIVELVDNLISQTQRQTIERCLEVRPPLAKTYKYTSIHKVDADFTDVGGPKFIKGQTHELESSLSEEEIIRNQALTDWTDNIKALRDINKNKK